MATSLTDFFAGQKLTALINAEAVKRNVPRKLPAALYQPSLTKPSTDQVEYISVVGNRANARAVARSSPARARELPGATRKYATAVNLKELMPIDINMLDALKSSNPLVQKNAQQQLVRSFADFKSLFENSRTSMVASAFANGKIWIGSGGNQLGSSSGAYTTVDYGIATGNQITKDGSGGTYNIGDWSSASTDIGAACRAIRDANLRSNGYELTTILYGTNIPSYLAKNTTLKEYFARFPEIRQSLAVNNEIPQGTLGFNWAPVHASYWTANDPDGNGASTAWFDDKYVGFIPDVSDDWYEFVEGGNLVPNGVATPSMNIDQMVELCSIVNGAYSYAEMTINPLSVNLIMGDSALPIIKVPGTVYYGTCA